MRPLPPMAEAIAEGGRAGSGATAGAGFNLSFKAPSTDNPRGLTPEPRCGAAWAARSNGAVNDIAKESGPAEAGIAETARVPLYPDGPHPNCG